MTGSSQILVRREGAFWLDYVAFLEASARSRGSVWLWNIRQLLRITPERRPSLIVWVNFVEKEIPRWKLELTTSLFSLKETVVPIDEECEFCVNTPTLFRDFSPLFSLQVLVSPSESRSRFY